MTTDLPEEAQVPQVDDIVGAGHRSRPFHEAEGPVSDAPTVIEPKIEPAGIDAASVAATDTAPAERLEVVLDGPPPWPASTPDGGRGVPPAPSDRAPSGSRPGAWKLVFVSALVGALVGGATASGVFLATNDDEPGSRTAPGSATVVGRPSDADSGPPRNTSVIGEPQDIRGILAKVEPAVVAVRTGAATSDATAADGADGGAGTGFVISSDGVIVTNNHVIEGSGGQIEVAFGDGTSLDAEVLGGSADNDLAVLKVDGKNLPVAQLGSSDSLAVGDEVVAIGNALALDGGLSVTRGIISAKGRTVPEAETGATLFNVLQTDAAINQGNSGGPLVNSAGEVVGINTALAGGSQNVGFAISIDSAKQVIDDLRQGKEVRIAFLGVESREVTPALARELDLLTKRGALIRRTTEDSGAEAAGLEANDVIVAIDGREVARPDDVAASIRRYQPGDQIEVTVERAGEQKTFTVKLGVRPDDR